MKVDWAPLRAELRHWHTAGLVLPFWWRDDDAVAPTAALERLIDVADAAGVPAHLAIVPREAREDMARHVAETPSLVPVVHGWAHQNHAPAMQKKAEFGLGRDMTSATRDLQAALKRMRDLFGAALAPMFVPPWNRIDPGLMPVLAKLEFDAVSTYLPRKRPEAAQGLVQINTHLDPIFWRGTRGLVASDELVSRTVALLQDRRQGRADNAEPFGYLTHHLVHDADIWEFSKQFLNEICQGPVTLYRHDQKEQT
ncbi:polysaccharide deacetylase family protein [Shimia sp. SDUM112013]|uniref:polysaccharide deacetylase family protein n=1 Tax=Shimia sp. SDUM112013 TaxID=3136160 RepID=UPI0032ECEFEF